jgi:hypothetical protein
VYIALLYEWLPGSQLQTSKKLFIFITSFVSKTFWKPYKSAWSNQDERRRLKRRGKKPSQKLLLTLNCFPDTQSFQLLTRERHGGENFRTSDAHS